MFRIIFKRWYSERVRGFVGVFLISWVRFFFFVVLLRVIFCGFRSCFGFWIGFFRGELEASRSILYSLWFVVDD